jgi:selenocysteine lyase/cysteine desulfurase
MPITEKYAYFDHAAVAPLPKPTHDAIQAWLQTATFDGDTQWPLWERRVEQLRQVAARLVNADQDEIGLINNTTTGISHVAEGLDWHAGDNVIVPDNEFPSNLYPWLNLQTRGVEVRKVEMPEGTLSLDRLAAACDQRTRLISLSWVGYANGYRLDPAAAARMAHDHNALLFLDAIQGLGVFPLDVKATDIDFFAADGHKWMLGPEGAGLLYIKRAILPQLRPLCVGWNSVVQRTNFSDHDFRIRPEVARYEGGSQNICGMHGLAASLELLTTQGLGPQRSVIAESVLRLTSELLQRLDQIGAIIHSPRDEKTRSGIVSFELPGRDPAQVRSRLLQEQIVLSVRHGWLRVAAHGYNNNADIEKLIGELEGK